MQNDTQSAITRLRERLDTATFGQADQDDVRVLLEELERLRKVESELNAYKGKQCATCGGNGWDTGAETPWGSLIVGPCPDCPTFNPLPADWREDSSLETWFPLTAKSISEMKAELDRLRWRKITPEDLPKVGDET